MFHFFEERFVAAVFEPQELSVGNDAIGITEIFENRVDADFMSGGSHPVIADDEEVVRALEELLEFFDAPVYDLIAPAAVRLYEAIALSSGRLPHVQEIIGGADVIDEQPGVVLGKECAGMTHGLARVELKSLHPAAFRETVGVAFAELP